MNELWRTLYIAIAALAGLGSAVAGQTQFQVDHYKVYRIEPHEVSIPVELQGVFDGQPLPANLVRLSRFANPADKNGEGIINPHAHLTVYELEEEVDPVDRPVTIENQFGQQSIRIGAAVAFMAPALKSEPGSEFPHGLDHYKCYQVLTNQNLGKSVTVRDQFGFLETEATVARLYCVPVEKRIDERFYPIKNRREHLVFYEIFGPREVHERWTRDQFGQRGMRTEESELLGVPSLPVDLAGACVDFGNLSAGTRYSVGATFNASGTAVEVKPFQWSSGGWTSGGYALIEGTGYAGGTGNEVMANNVTLAFGFSGVTDLRFRFGEYGGNLNLEINGDFRNFENLSDIHGATIGGVGVAVVNGLGNDRGVVILSGSIATFAIGGQELWLDDLCPGSSNA